MQDKDPGDPVAAASLSPRRTLPLAMICVALVPLVLLLWAGVTVAALRSASLQRSWRLLVLLPRGSLLPVLRATLPIRIGIE